MHNLLAGPTFDTCLLRLLMLLKYSTIRMGDFQLYLSDILARFPYFYFLHIPCFGETSSRLKLNYVTFCRCSGFRQRKTLAKSQASGHKRGFASDATVSTKCVAASQRPANVLAVTHGAPLKNLIGTKNIERVEGKKMAYIRALQV